MYGLLVFHDNKKQFVNCIYVFTNLKDALHFTKNKLKYQDIPSKKYKYKNHKCFFEIRKLI